MESQRLEPAWICLAGSDHSRAACSRGAGASRPEGELSQNAVSSESQAKDENFIREVMGEFGS